MGNLRNNFGDESPYSLLGVLIIAAIFTVLMAVQYSPESMKKGK